MLNDSLVGSGDEPPPASRAADLKQFRSAGRGYWSNVSDKDWNDWRWQLKNRITTLEKLELYLPTMTPEERAGALLTRVSKVFFNLAQSNTNDTIQAIEAVESPKLAAHCGRQPSKSGRRLNALKIWMPSALTRRFAGRSRR